MPALTVRNIPDETMDGLHRRAKNAHRSLNGEILLIFEDALMGLDLPSPGIRIANPVPRRTGRVG